MRLLASHAVAASVSLAATNALAFSYETPASDGCHERITSDALRAVRREGRARALPFTRDERALANDVPFTVPDDLDDLAGVTLLIGVRDNDLRGRGPADLEQLAMLHGDDDVQREHCLRRDNQDGHPGTVAAVADCREFIRSRFIAAIDAAEGARADVKLVLDVRGQVTAPLPAFYVRIGEALHALQDSFTHTFRTADGSEITVVLNWIDNVRGQLREGRDGPAHLSPLDRCDDKDDLRTKRRTWATAASTEVLRIATDPALDRTAKLAALDTTLDRWLGVRSGCDEANRWCNAPELALQDEGCSCSAARGGDAAVGFAALGGLAALIFLRRTRLAALGTLILASAPAIASADDVPVEEQKKEEKKEEKEEQKKDDKGPAFPTPCPEPASTDEGSVARGTKKVLGEPTHDFGVHASAGASFDSTAFALALGARYRLADTWLVGADAEWNPWGSPLSTVHRGAFNAYATGIRRWTIRSDTYALRTSLHLGISRMLFDLYGVPSGTTGFYGGISFLGLEVKLGSGVTMIFEPADFALPVPQLKGYFGYPQYRFTIGLQWGAAGR